MTTRLADPGRRVGGGRLRVDAARAIAKLREYQLPDRAMWVLEAIRAAVASGARPIELDGDADDVWLVWEGAPWPGEVVCRLFDELVSPSPARDAAPHRLLATAVNSALGMDPAHVDVFSLAEDGTALRVRYTPALLEDAGSDGAEPGLRQLAAEPSPWPEPATAAGMVVHLRRRVGLGTLRYLISKPPELDLAASACADIAVQFEVEGRAVGRHISRDLMQVPLGGEIDGFLALTAAGSGGQLEVAEHGVVIARYPLPVPELDEPRTPLPLRLFVDGPAMPTSASRADVRLDAYPIAAALGRVSGCLGLLVDQIAAAHATSPDGPARGAALALLAPAIAGPAWAHAAVAAPEPFARLACLPLLRDARGRRRAPADSWRNDAVHTGSDPLPAELVPWIDRVLWLPAGDPANALFGGAPVDDGRARDLVKWARRQQHALERFERRPIRPLEVAPGPDQLVRIRIAAESGPSAIRPAQIGATAGELCLLAGAGGGQVVLLWHGREIETVDLGGSLPFVAVVDASAFTPGADYRFLQRDGSFLRLNRSILAAAVRAAEALAQAPDADPIASPRTLRRALDLAFRLRSESIQDSPLFAAKVWPTLDGKHVSTAELATQPAIGALPAGVGLYPIDGRIVVHADPADMTVLHALIEPTTRVIDYSVGARAAPEARAASMAAQLAGGGLTVLAICEPGIRGAIAWGQADRSLVIAFHSGIRVGEAPYLPLLGACIVWADADAIVPSPSWTVAPDVAGLAWHSFVDWERAIARAVARRLAGDPVPELYTFPPEIQLASGPGLQLCAALEQHDPDWVLGSELRNRLAQRRLFATLDGKRRSAAELAASFAAEIEIVERAPAQSWPWPEGRAPVIADAASAGALARLAGKPVRDVSSDLVNRGRQARRQSRLDEHRGQPPAALPEPSPQVVVDFAFGQLRVGPGTEPGLHLTVHVEGRPFQRAILGSRWPLVAAIDVAAEAVDAEGQAIETSALNRIAAAAPRAVGRLLSKLARTDPTQLVNDVPVCRLLALWLEQARVRGETAAVLTALASAPAFPTVQGDRASVKAAEFAYHISVARWSGEWIAPADGEPRHLLDRPILALTDGEAGAHRQAAIAHLADPQELDDLTHAVAAMQLERRMAHGLAPRPLVRGASRELTRSLHALGVGKLAGRPGEIALVNTGVSRLILHRDGQPIAHIAIDIEPPVAIAVEGADLVGLAERELDSLRTDGQETAGRLVSEVTAAVGTGELPPWLCSALRLALARRRLDSSHVRRARPYVTTAGEWVGIAELEEQQRLFGNVWAVPPGTGALPLDPDRIAIHLDRTHVSGTALALCLDVIDANDELLNDTLARVNRARAPVAALELTEAGLACALAVVRLDGDGVHRPRGLVAALAPAAAERRGVRCHREMKPLCMVADPCPWPTFAVVDFAFTPDRTFSKPVDDPVWRAVASEITAASERALRSVDPPPADALASLALSAGRADAAAVRGWLWLHGPPAPAEIVVRARDRQVVLFAERAGTPVPVAGWMVIDRLYTDSVMHDIDAAYRTLVAELANRTDDLAAAHLAHALALGMQLGDAFAGFRFTCFAPVALPAAALAELFVARGRVPVITPGTEVEGEEPVLIDDGSAAAQVILTHLGRRARRVRSAPRRSAPRRPNTLSRRWPPRSASRLRDLELSDAHFERVSIAPDEPDPILRCADRALLLAGDSELLRAVEAARLAGTAWSDSAIDAVVAHALTVLRHGSGAVTEMIEYRALESLLSR